MDESPRNSDFEDSPLRKRRKLKHERASSEEESDSGSEASPRGIKRNDRSHVLVLPPSFPQSVCQGWEAPFEPISERDLLDKAIAQKPKDAEVYLQLDDFCIYNKDKTGRFDTEFVCLSKLSQDLYAEFMFDGRVSVGEQTFYLIGVPFVSLMVGYDDGEPITQSLWIESKHSQRLRRSVYYQLGQPGPDYARFYKPFLWLAQFARYFVEYLVKHQGIILRHFRRLFLEWLTLNHGDNTMHAWLACGKLQDFRTTVAANHGFLWKECCGIDADGQSTGTKIHPLWGEIDPRWLTAIPRQPEREGTTVVTPFAFNCFSQMYFASRLKPMDVNPAVLPTVRSRKAALGLTPWLLRHAHNLPTPESLRESSEADGVSPGDVVSLAPDRTSWKNSTTKAWYAYVQDVRPGDEGDVMDLIWLYEPADTTIGKAEYPFAHELFMSDNCECGTAAWPVSSATGKISVSWYSSDPYGETDYFVRQKFRTVEEHDTYDFVKLQPADFKCGCTSQRSVWIECRDKYREGDAVLVLEKPNLHPALIVRFEEATHRVVLQELAHGSDAPQNELYPSPRTYDKPPSAIVRVIQMGIFPDYEAVPAPYNRNGVGDFYYMREAHFEDLAIGPTWGWDPGSMPLRPKLSGMGLFCGGGNYDRGIEEGGAVDFRFAVDWNEAALHSYRANANHHVNFFLGSANDALARGLAGDPDPVIAQVGEVDFIAAGSPCQGFSRMNCSKLSPAALQNSSMVASVVAYVDLYSPKYCILENVLSMKEGSGPQKDQNVFSQMIASLVGMGYQVQQWLGDAWCVGSSQNRSRLFIIASAPGLPPLEPPPQTHAHPRDTRNLSRNLGKTSNNLAFASRQDNYTHFGHVSAREATKDLPILGDVPPTCIQHPDHRTSIRATLLNKRRIAVVPTRPQGMSLARAAEQGLVSGEPLEYITRRQKGDANPRSIKSFSRVPRDGLFPTVTTGLAAHCRRTGRWLHWDELRVITVLEARRAQGFLHHEVIVGQPATQFKIVGNSVDRKISLVLGLALRQSWEKARTGQERVSL